MPSARNSLQLSSVSRKRHLSTLRPSLTTLRKSGVKCSGEVQVLKVEGDFAQWGIKILVSYRDIDRLKTLTGTHQSGGVSLFFFSITLSCLMSSAAFIICLLGTVTCYSHLSHELVRDVSNTLLAGRWNQPSALNLFLRNWSFTLPLTVTLGYGSARRASGAQSTCGGYMRCPGWTVGYMFWICLNIY